VCDRKQLFVSTDRSISISKTSGSGQIIRRSRSASAQEATCFSVLASMDILFHIKLTSERILKVCTLKTVPKRKAERRFRFKQCKFYCDVIFDVASRRPATSRSISMKSRNPTSPASIKTVARHQHSSSRPPQSWSSTQAHAQRPAAEYMQSTVGSDVQNVLAKYKIGLCSAALFSRSTRDIRNAIFSSEKSANIGDDYFSIYFPFPISQFLTIYSGTRAHSSLL
jgi:hypothetical protein